MTSPLRSCVFLLLTLAGMCVAAPAVAAPELHLRVMSIGTPFGPPAAPPQQRVFYRGEELEIELHLMNRTARPIDLGDAPSPAGWARSAQIHVMRSDAEPGKAVKSTARLLRQQIVGKAAGAATVTLLPGETLVSGWSLTSDGLALEAGSYTVTADLSLKWPSLRSNQETLVVREAQGRTDELNQLYHAAVRARWAKRFPEAEQKLQKLLALVPGSPVAYSELGAVYRDQKDYSRAIRALEQAIGILQAGKLPAEEPTSKTVTEDWLAALRDRVRELQRRKAETP